MVPRGYAGKLRYNKSLLPKDFPAEFTYTIKLLRRTLSRTLEAGCRPIIAVFLSFAVEKARKLYSHDRLVVHQEIAVPEVHIPKVGYVGGILDFMTAEIIGLATIGQTPHFFMTTNSIRRGNDRHGWNFRVP